MSKQDRPLQHRMGFEDPARPYARVPDQIKDGVMGDRKSRKLERILEEALEFVDDIVYSHQSHNGHAASGIGYKNQRIEP